jgi:hypothetical protein
MKEAEPRYRNSDWTLAVAACGLCLSSFACTRPARLLDLHASFREIWQGSEQWDSGKEAEPSEHVTLDLDCPASTSVVGISFSPVGTGACGSSISAVVAHGASGPSSVELAPERPLLRGCSYELVIPDAASVAKSGAHLAAPVRVRFRVAPSNVGPAERELEQLDSDSTSGTLRSFAARPGINTPVQEALERYQSAIGISARELVPTSTQSSANMASADATQLYVQHRDSYEVSGYGYMIVTHDGFFRSAHGKIKSKLPRFPPPRLTESEALRRVIAVLGLEPPPWEQPGRQLQAPRGLRELIQVNGRDFTPVWGFRFQGSGYTALSYIDIDASSGGVVAKDTYHVIE